MPLDLQTTGHWGRDPAFLIEGDEYIVSPDDRRSKFELYHPRHVLISSLVHDHINVFPTIESYEAPFGRLVDLLPAEGLLVCAHAHPALHRLAAGRPVVWYGLEPCPGYFADEVVIGEITRFVLRTPSGGGVALQTQLLGLHNIENIVGASALLLELGLIDAEALQAGRAAIPRRRAAAGQEDPALARPGLRGVRVVL